MASRKRTKWYDNLLKVNTHFITEEIKRGSLSNTLLKSFKARSLQFGDNISPNDLLEERARENPGKTFIVFEGESWSFGEINKRAKFSKEWLKHKNVYF